MRRDVDYLLASPGLSHLAPISFPARSKIRKPEQSTKLSVSISFSAFGPDPHVDHLGNLLAVFQREQSPDDPVATAVDASEALQGTA
jgi:hypothetical protein